MDNKIKSLASDILTDLHNSRNGLFYREIENRLLTNRDYIFAVFSRDNAMIDKIERETALIIARNEMRKSEFIAKNQIDKTMISFERQKRDLQSYKRISYKIDLRRICDELEYNDVISLVDETFAEMFAENEMSTHKTENQTARMVGAL